MQKLIQGIHAFRNEDFRPLQGLFEELAKGQKPETLFITCSDSRIDPNLLTRSNPGELFILRNAGNIVPAHGAPQSGEAATVEFAVAALGVIALPSASMRLGLPDGSQEPEDSTQYKAYTIIGEEFGAGIMGPLLVTAALPEPLTDAELLATQVAVSNQLAANEDVTAVVPVGVSEADDDARRPTPEPAAPPPPPAPARGLRPARRPRGSRPSRP